MKKNYIGVKLMLPGDYIAIATGEIINNKRISEAIYGIIKKKANWLLEFFDLDTV